MNRLTKKIGFPVGSATLIDKVGIDVAAKISEYLGKEFGARMGDWEAQSAILKEMVANGWLGTCRGVCVKCQSAHVGRKSCFLSDVDWRESLGFTTHVLGLFRPLQSEIVRSCQEKKQNKYAQYCWYFGCEGDKGASSKRGVFNYEESNKGQKDHPDNEDAIELMKKHAVEPKLPYVRPRASRRRPRGVQSLSYSIPQRSASFTTNEHRKLVVQRPTRTKNHVRENADRALLVVVLWS